MANYDTVRDGIVGRLHALGYVESAQSIDFKNAPVSEYSCNFILKCLSGENLNDQIIDRFDDKQEWQIQIAFTRSGQNDKEQYNATQRAKDAIIKDLDKPANWQSFVKILKYKRWEILEFNNYFVLDIRLDVLDEYNHG